MPTGMMLRSITDWYLGAARENAFMADLEERGLAPHDFDPIPVWLFLDYAEWFQEKVGIEPVPNLVARDPESLTGTSRRRSRVAGALSSPTPSSPDITHFTMIPEWVERCLPSDCWSHTCTLVHSGELRGKRVLIVGGHQSAFEWAALLVEGGTEEVHVVHRHDPPPFEPADWSFTDELM